METTASVVVGLLKKESGPLPKPLFSSGSCPDEGLDDQHRPCRHRLRAGFPRVRRRLRAGRRLRRARLGPQARLRGRRGLDARQRVAARNWLVVCARADRCGVARWCRAHCEELRHSTVEVIALVNEWVVSFDCGGVLAAGNADDLSGCQVRYCQCPDEGGAGGNC